MAEGAPDRKYGKPGARTKVRKGRSPGVNAQCRRPECAAPDQLCDVGVEGHTRVPCGGCDLFQIIDYASVGTDSRD
jgi:hypothetical protein